MFLLLKQLELNVHISQLTLANTISRIVVDPAKLKLYSNTVVNQMKVQTSSLIVEVLRV